jgi:hypothetical protein
LVIWLQHNNDTHTPTTPEDASPYHFTTAIIMDQDFERMIAQAHARQGGQPRVDTGTPDKLRGLFHISFITELTPI